MSDVVSSPGKIFLMAKKLGNEEENEEVLTDRSCSSCLRVINNEMFHYIFSNNVGECKNECN